MSNIILPDNHYFLEVSGDINSICMPLLKYFQVNLFVYGRYYDNGKCYIFSNNRNWLKHHLKMGYTVPAPLPKGSLNKKESFNIILNSGPFSKAKHDIVNLFQSDQGIDLIYKGKSFYEVFCFSFSPYAFDPVNTFMNDIDLFRNFCFFFKDKAEKIIKNAESSKLILPVDMRGIAINGQIIDKGKDIELKFKKEIVSKKYFIDTEFGEIKFTPSEVKCIAHLLKGHSIMDSAKLLGISPRTLESYLDTIKSKLGCHKKPDVINFLVKYDFLRGLVE